MTASENSTYSDIAGQADYITLGPVHTSQRANVREDVLQRVLELESIDIANTELNVSINDELRKTQDFSTQVASVSKTTYAPTRSPS